MPLIPDPPFPKTQGDNIRSKDWNDAVTEIIRLDNAKANRAGDTFTGPLTVNGRVGIGTTAAAAAALEVVGADWQTHLRLTNTSDTGAGPGLYFNSTARNWAVLATHGGASAGPGRFAVYDATSSAYRLVIDSAGSVGIGIDTPEEKLHVVGRIRSGSLNIGPWAASGVYQAVGVSTMDQSKPGNYALLQGASGPDLGRTFLNSPLSIQFRIGNVDRAILENNGNFVVGASTNAIRFSDGWTAFADSGTNRAEISNDVGTYKTLMIAGNKSNGGLRRVSVWDRLEVNGTFMVASGTQTISIGVPSGPYAGDGIRGAPNLWLDANGGRVILKAGFTSQGMDVAERFPVIGEVQAGEVVVYDEATAAVRPCTRAYDSTAVGIVSEAPAFILGLELAEAPIALCGRVPCFVDADIAPIVAGDLLVASATPGHAQKLVDPGRAAGRVIGKALESLASGRGRILAFVLAA